MVICRGVGAKWSRGVLLSLLCASILGCGGPTGIYTDVTTQYPPELYIMYVGISEVSLAEAENRACAGVAAQVRSSLESELEAVARSVTLDGKTSDTQATTQRIAIRAEFERAELIHVDRERSEVRGGTYQAVAFLSRREAEQVFDGDYAMASAALRSRASGLDAVSEGDVPGFASVYWAAREAFDEVARAEAEYRAVTGRSQAEFAQDRDLWWRIQQRRQTVLDGLRVGLRMREPRIADDRLDEARLVQIFSLALANLGLSVRGQSCGEAEYLLDLQPDVKYQGIIGIVCRLSFTGQLIECGGGETWELHLDSDAFTGDGSHESTARREAEMAVTEATLAPLLAAALCRVLPVEGAAR